MNNESSCGARCYTLLVDASTCSGAASVELVSHNTERNAMQSNTVTHTLTLPGETVRALERWPIWGSTTCSLQRSLQCSLQLCIRSHCRGKPCVSLSDAAGWSHDATPSQKRGVFAGFDEYVSFEASLSSSGWRSRPAPILPGVRVDPGVTRSTPTVHQGPTGEAVGGPVVFNWCYLR